MVMAVLADRSSRDLNIRRTGGWAGSDATFLPVRCEPCLAGLTPVSCRGRQAVVVTETDVRATLTPSGVKLIAD